MQSLPHSLSLKEKQRRERETLILHVAEEVFLEKGYYETSMDEIAARVGIAKGTIYLHFPGKEELVLAIFQRDMQQFIQSIDDVIASMLTARAKLEALLQFMYIGLFSKHTQLLSSIYNEIDMRRMLSEKKGSLHSLWECVASRVSEILEDGKARGEFDPTIPTPVMVTAFFHLFSPRTFDHLILNQSQSHDELIKQLGQIYFKGIAITPADTEK